MSVYALKWLDVVLKKGIQPSVDLPLLVLREAHSWLLLY